MLVKHIIISGRVQGVGFRRYVFQEAQKLELKGWVRNLFDGRVEVLVQINGDSEAVFLTAVKKGPLSSRVTDIEVHDFDKEITLAEFEVREDGSHPHAE
jgi:acylphosphatase